MLQENNILNEKIKLKSEEITAYLWIKIIKLKLRELSTLNQITIDEQKFLSIFVKLNEYEWREFYIEFSKYILENFNSDIFLQGTEKGTHDVLNELINRILNTNIPNIDLSRKNEKNYMIVTKDNEVCEISNSSFGKKLIDEYDKEYMLTGDESDLEFYNLFLATIIKLKEKDMFFTSIEDFRMGFCKKYNDEHNLIKNLEKTIKLFNKMFKRASDNYLILGNYYGWEFVSMMNEYDTLPLKKYFEEADSYADAVLNQNQKKHSKKILNY